MELIQQHNHMTSNQWVENHGLSRRSAARHKLVVVVGLPFECLSLPSDGIDGSGILPPITHPACSDDAG